MYHGLCTLRGHDLIRYQMLIAEQILNVDWLARKRLCKHTPHGPCDIMWFEGIL